MGKAGRRKRDDLAYETFDGTGCSSGLQFELAPNNESGYAGVFLTTSGRWQATVRVERDGKKVRRNVGSYDTKEEAALQRALASQGTVLPRQGRLVTFEYRPKLHQDEGISSI
jgi:hypothetical protein